jgi:hypothetical protein
MGIIKGERDGNANYPDLIITHVYMYQIIAHTPMSMFPSIM